MHNLRSGLRSRKTLLAMLAAFCVGLIFWVRTESPFGPVGAELLGKAMTCQQMPCFLALNSLITDFSWDTMYVFTPDADDLEIGKVLHAAPPSFSKDTLKIAFVKNGRLVHFEEESYDLENAHHNRIDFVVQADLHYGVFLPSTSFNISAGGRGNTFYFVFWDFCHLTENGQAHKGPCPLLE